MGRDYTQQLVTDLNDGAAHVGRDHKECVQAHPGEHSCRTAILVKNWISQGKQQNRPKHINVLQSLQHILKETMHQICTRGFSVSQVRKLHHHKAIRLELTCI